MYPVCVSICYLSHKQSTTITISAILLQKNHPANERVEEENREDCQDPPLLLDDLDHEHHAGACAPYEANHYESKLDK